MQTQSSAISTRWAKARQFFWTAALSCGLMALLLMGGVHATQAQDTDLLAQRASEVEGASSEAVSEGPVEPARIPLKVTSPIWIENFGVQCANLLESGSKQVRSATLQNIVFFATHNSNVIDFSKTWPKLFEVYERDPVEEHRIMAATALHAMALSRPAPGNDLMMERLYKLVHEERSKRVRRHTLHVLADYHRRQGRKLYIDSWLYRTTVR